MYVIAAVVVVVMVALLAVNLNKTIEFKPVVQIQQPQDPQHNTLSVSGSSQITVAPDRAIAYVSIVTEDKKVAKNAQDKNRDISNAVINALKAWGVNASDIETETYSLEKIQEWESVKNKYVDNGYRLTHTLKVTTGKINDMGSLVDLCVNAGANGIDRITFDLSKESEKNARDAALIKATQVAVEKGQNLASTAGVKLGKVMSVYEQNYYYTPFEFNTKNAMGSSDAGAPAPTSISPQKVEVSSSVQLVFEINQGA